MAIPLTGTLNADMPLHGPLPCDTAHLQARSTQAEVGGSPSCTMPPDPVPSGKMPSDGNLPSDSKPPETVPSGILLSEEAPSQGVAGIPTLQPRNGMPGELPGRLPLLQARLPLLRSLLPLHCSPVLHPIPVCYLSPSHRPSRWQ